MAVKNNQHTTTYRCPHPDMHLSSYYCMCVLKLLHVCPHTTSSSDKYAVNIHIYIIHYRCPHTPIYASSYYYKSVLIYAMRALTNTPSKKKIYYTIRVLVLLCASSYYYKCFLILLFTTIYVSSYDKRPLTNTPSSKKNRHTAVFFPHTTNM